MNNPGEGEDRETGEDVTQSEAEAAEGQTTEVSAIQGEDGDRDAPQPQEEEAKGEEPAENGPPQPEGDRATGEELEEEAAGETQKQDPEPDVTGGCCSWLTCPENLLLYKTETCKIFMMSKWLCGFEFLSFAITFVSALYYRTFGSANIESLSLAIAMFNIAGVSVGIGLAQTFNTLMSQTYGCLNMKRIGVMLQRALLFGGLICFFSWSVLINTEPIALLLKRTPQVARDAHLYSYIMIPAVPCWFLYQLQAKFLQNQKIFWPQLLTALSVNILNWAMNHVLVYQLQLGVVGSAVSTSISHGLLALFLFIIIVTKGLHKTTWPGWTQDCLQEWGSFSVTAFLSVIMLCAEVWVFEAWVFIGGNITKVELGGLRLIYNMYIGLITIPMGIAEAASVGVGNNLGANNVERAKRSFWGAMFWAGVVAAPFAIFLNHLGKVFGIAYTEDWEIMDNSANGMMIFFILYCLDANARVVGGVIRGAGQVWKAAFCSLGSYIIGFYLCVVLCTSDKGIMGYGMGIFTGVALQSIFYTFIMFKLEWPLAVEKAQARAGILMGDKIRMIPRGPRAPNQPVPVRRVMVVGDALSWNQLVPRRFLALCFAAEVLVAARVGRVFAMELMAAGGAAAHG